MKQKKLVIGLFGFGVVGEGIYNVLKETPSLDAVIKRICVKNSCKERNAPADLFTTDPAELLYDKEINLIVELINDPSEAYMIVCTAIGQRKAVVSANKKMIAENLTHLLQLQKEYDTPLLYEGAVCGSIPIIRNLEEYYDNDMLKGICGIVNGSTNFILTKMIDHAVNYQEALSEARALGFAETDPSLDVSGKDSVNKLTILLLHAYGLKADPGDILHRGIASILVSDANVAEERGYKIKLIARAGKIAEDQVAAYVFPQFIKEDSPLHNVKNEYNGVVIESKLADKQFLYGKGAGRYPTSSAVLSDIAALRYNYRYEYRKQLFGERLSLSSEFYLRLYVSFDNWNDVNKADFEWIEEVHSTENRQFLVGVIHFEKLIEASWFADQNVSIILMPDAIVEKDSIVHRNLKKLSLQLATGSVAISSIFVWGVLYLRIIGLAA
jgi:homoserine dehydrogenase